MINWSRLRYFSITAVLAVLVMFFSTSQSVKAYDITQYRGHLTIKEDNSATFHQKVVYNYKDSYNGQYVTLGTAGHMPQGFAVQPDHIQYMVYKNGTLVGSKTDEASNNFGWVDIENMGDGYRLKIYNSVSNGDVVEVQVSWPLQNVLFPYQDIAELNWVPISDWDVPLKNIEIQITAPESLQSQLAAHTGYLRKAAQVDKLGTDYLVRLDRLEKGKNLEIHAYWDSGILSALEKDQFLAEDHLAHYQTTEANIQKYSQLMERLTYVWLPTTAVLTVIIDGAHWFIFRRKVDLRTKMLKNVRVYETPSDLSPMQVTRTIYNIDFNAINPVNARFSRIDFDHVAQATILDLIDRGNLAIEEKGRKPLLTCQSDKRLTTAENVFLEMAFSDQKTLAMDQLFSDFSADQQVLKERTRKQEKAIRLSGKNLIEKYNQSFSTLRSAVEDERHRLNLPVYYRDFNPAERRESFSIGLPSLLSGSCYFSLLLLLTPTIFNP